MDEEKMEVYACPAVRRVTGDTVRPGGLELTRQGVALLELPAGSRIVDVGCGAGASVAFLRRELALDAIGIEPSEVMRAGGQGLPLYPGRAEALPLADASADAAMLECCFHLTQTDRALRELHRVLRPGGRLLLTDLYPRQENAPGGLLTRAELEALLRENGFALLRWQDEGAALRQLMVDLIMEYGSMEKFWDSLHCSCGGCSLSAYRDCRLSYYLLTAQRTEWKEEREECI